MKEARNLKPIKGVMKIDFVISEKRDAAEISTGYEIVKTYIICKLYKKEAWWLISAHTLRKANICCVCVIVAGAQFIYGRYIYEQCAEANVFRDVWFEVGGCQDNNDEIC